MRTLHRTVVKQFLDGLNCLNFYVTMCLIVNFGVSIKTQDSPRPFLRNSYSAPICSLRTVLISVSKQDAKSWLSARWWWEAWEVNMDDYWCSVIQWCQIIEHPPFLRWTISEVWDFWRTCNESHIPNRKNPRRISTERLDRLNAER